MECGWKEGWTVVDGMMGVIDCFLWLEGGMVEVMVRGRRVG